MSMNKGKSSVPSCASSCQGLDSESSQSLLSRLTPIFSREMSLQAHFSFGAQTAGGPHTCVPQLMARDNNSTSSSLDPAPKHFTWTANDGSQCSMACGQQGLSVSYNNSQQAPLMGQHVCSGKHAAGQDQGREFKGLHLPLPQSKGESADRNNRGDLPVRSLTFSGTQNVAKAPQKPYGRRCKSTAHIVLKQNENKSSTNLPHEFHSLPTRDYTKPRDKSREANDKKDERPSRPRMPSNLNKIQENLPCDFCQPPPLPPPMNCCSCHQCSVHRMVTSLPPCSCPSCLHNYHHHHRHYHHPEQQQQQHQSCYHHHQHHQHHHGHHPHYHHDDHEATDTGRGSATFNSHKCYDDQRGGRGRSSGGGNSPCRAGGPKRKSPLPRSHSDQKHRSHPEHHLPQDRKDSGPRLPRVGVAYPSHQDDRGGGDGTESRRSRGKVRPRTIHIDVYCSTSSDDDTIGGHYSSDDSPNPTVPRTLVALGSKNSKKNQVDLKKRDMKGDHLPAGEDAASFIFQRGQTRSPRQSAFITDVPLTLSGSPSRAISRTTTSASQPDTSTASDATKILSPRKENILQLISRNEPQPVRPTTLPIPSLVSPASREELLKRRRHNSSLSYVSSPLDFGTWEADQDIPSSGLSWRGSEFDASASQQSDNETDDHQRQMSLTRSEVFYEGDSEGTEVESNADNASLFKFWRSPQLERRKYIQKGQEDRYKESIKRRTERSTEVPPPVIPSDVDALSKLSVFKNFSTEELEVISKSLNKRESVNSADHNQSSFRAIEREESLKLLKRMASFSEPGQRGFHHESEAREGDVMTEASAFDQRHSKVHRSSSLNSRTSSSSSRASQAMIKTLDPIDDDKMELNGSQCSAALASPLSKSLQGIPGEVDEVSALERHCTSLPSNSSAQKGTPVLIGERLVNVGVFRNLQGFPFSSQTIPSPSHHRLLNRRQYSPSERLFVRPQMFGEVLRSQRRRPIHFGPPRNPQCSCESCSGAWAEGMVASSHGGARTGLDPVSIRAWSLSDLGPAASPTLMPPHTSSPSLSLNTASDISALPQLGSATSGGEQHQA